MTTDPTDPITAVERVARRLAARERLGDEARWGETSAEFRDLYRGAAREVIALMQEPGAEPAGERAALRDRIAEAIRDAACSGDCGETEEECAKERIQPFAWHHGRLAVVEGEPEQFADAVLAVLPEPADRAAVVAQAVRACAEHLRITYSDTWTADAANSLDLHAARIERGEPIALLRRLADETPAAEAQPESCAHCGQPISRITGTLAAWWVHDPGGNTVCHPEQAASSTRATPKTAVTMHAIPLPGSNGISACCGRPPCEFVGERVTRDPDKVTCTGAAAGARQDGVQPDDEPFAGDTRRCRACGHAMDAHIRVNGQIECAFGDCTDPAPDETQPSPPSA